MSPLDEHGLGGSVGVPIGAAGLSSLISALFCAVPRLRYVRVGHLTKLREDLDA